MEKEVEKEQIDVMDSGFGISGLWRKRTRAQVIAENKAEGQCSRHSACVVNMSSTSRVRGRKNGEGQRVSRSEERDPFTGKVTCTGCGEIRTRRCAVFLKLHKETKREHVKV